MFIKLAAVLKAVFWDFLSVKVLGGIIVFAIGLGLAQIISILGVGTIAYQGSLYTLDWIVLNMSNLFLSLPPWQFEILSMVATRLRFDDIFTVLFTAFSTVLALWTFKGAWRVFGFGQG